MAKTYRFRFTAHPAEVSGGFTTIEFTFVPGAYADTIECCTLAEVHGRFQAFCASFNDGPTKAAFCGMANPNDRKPPNFEAQYKRPTILTAPEVTA